MPLRTFLDSGVLLAAFRGDSQSHQAAMAIIDDDTRELVVSDLVKLEVIPKASFHKRAEEVAFYEAIFDAASTISVTTGDAINRAIELAKKNDLAPIDACHAERALSEMVDEFVTTEKPTKPLFRINSEITNFISIYPQHKNNQTVGTNYKSSIKKLKNKLIRITRCWK